MKDFAGWYRLMVSFLALTPSTIYVPSLISLRVIDIHDKDEIRQGGTNVKMVETLIEKFVYPELSAGETTRFNFFLAALRRTGKIRFLSGKDGDTNCSLP